MRGETCGTRLRPVQGTQVALRQVVVEGQPEVVRKSEHYGAVSLQLVELVLGQRLPGSAAPPGGREAVGCVFRWRSTKR